MISRMWNRGRTGRDREHWKSLGTNWRQESKKYLIADRVKAGHWTIGVCSWADAWINGDCSLEFSAMLVRTRGRVVSRRALLVSAKCRWRGAEELRERIKNLVIFEKRPHKKRRDHSVYYSEIKTYHLAITMNKVPERLSKRVPTVGCWLRFVNFSD